MICKNCGRKIKLNGLEKKELIRIINSGWKCNECGTTYKWAPVEDMEELPISLEKLFE